MVNVCVVTADNGEMRGEKMDTTDTVIRLAHEYVADTEHKSTAGWLRCRAAAYLGVPAHVEGRLAFNLLVHTSEHVQVDHLLCQIDMLEHAADDHSVCCDYECHCSRSDTTFVHPTCGRCDDIRVDKLDQAVRELLGLLPDDVRPKETAA